MSDVIVITPTTGAPELADAVRSVQEQTVPTDHLLVVDGEKFEAKTRERCSQFIKQPSTCVLPFNTGGGGFYGHRIMAAFSHLINHKYILFLDQDNTFDPNHVESMVKEIESFGLDWAYSLRKIVDKEHNFICNDDCESLGRWPVYGESQSYLIDSSCYCFKTEFFRQVGHIWDFGWGADRRFYTILKDQVKHVNYTCTGKYTMNYRMGGNADSVQPGFFIEGNKITHALYNGKFPWVSQSS